MEGAPDEALQFGSHTDPSVPQQLSVKEAKALQAQFPLVAKGRLVCTICDVKQLEWPGLTDGILFMLNVGQFVAPAEYTNQLPVQIRPLPVNNEPVRAQLLVYCKASRGVLASAVVDVPSVDQIEAEPHWIDLSLIRKPRVGAAPQLLLQLRFEVCQFGRSGYSVPDVDLVAWHKLASCSGALSCAEVPQAHF